MKETYVIIPALEPERQLLEYLKELCARIQGRVVLVDDGSGPDYAEIFQQAVRLESCVVLTHERNLGKGCALKTGFSYAKKESGVHCLILCADSDGQHEVQDMIRLCAIAEKYPGTSAMSVSLVSGLTILFSSIYLIWRIFGTIPWSAGFWQAAVGVVLAAAETTTMLGMFELMISKMRSGKTELIMPEPEAEEYPEVDVLIATHNEPEELLYKTINACMFLEYPDRKKVHVYVCDDGNRLQNRRLSKKLGAGYLGLAENQHAKSGNYNQALEKTSSPLIATFDADMIPRRTFLMRTVPYFLIPDCPVGLVQTPQSFYNQDLFQFNLYSEKDIPNEQDFFSREINVMRNASNSSAYTGSNTVILRKAMEEIGGFPYDTITEDFETSLRLQKAGYITYASEEVLASGLSTTTVSSMISQRIRWARGVIQSIRNTNAIFTEDLPVAARMSYLNAYWYWWSFFNRMVFILAPILFALFDFQLVECGFWELVIFWLPSHLLYSLSVRYLSTNVRTMRWSQIIDTILAPYLIFPVLLESIGIKQLKFKVTQKEKTSVKTTSFWYVIPHAILISLTLAAISITVRYRQQPLKAGLCGGLILGLIGIVKNNGLFFAGLAFGCMVWAVGRNQAVRMRIRLAALAAAGALSACPWFLWQYYVAHALAGTEHKFSLTASAEALKPADPALYEKIVRAFWQEGTTLYSRTVQAFLFCNLLVFAACWCAKVFFHRRWKLMRTLFLADLVVLVYYAGILCLYLFSMPEEEAVRLAGFERYASSIMVWYVGILILQAEMDMERSFAVDIDERGSYMAYSSPEAKRRYQYGVLICLVAATDRDDQVSDWSVWYVCRYFLFAPNVDVTQELTEEELEGYDYVIVLEEEAAERIGKNSGYGRLREPGIYKVEK